jgi:hypothetical protein
VGFINESEPIKILQTPSLINIEEYLEEKLDSKNALSFINNSFKKN